MSAVKHLSKTNALRILDSLGVPYEATEFETDGAVSGVEAASRLGADESRVYKTLVTVGKSGAHYVFVVPVAEELDLRKAAVAAGEKNIAMIHSKELLPLTGYIHGGCSPIGMKKAFPTFIDTSAEALDFMVFSGGRIGLQVKMAPDSLIKAANATYKDLVLDRN